MLRELGDADRERRLGGELALLVCRGQARRDRLPMSFELRDVELPAAGIVVNQHLLERMRGVAIAFAEGDRFVRRHRADRLAEGHGQPLHRGQTDADAGERARAAGRGEEVEAMAVDVALAEEPVDGREELLVARALPLECGGGEDRVVAEQRHG